MTTRQPKAIIIFPAYFAEKTLEQTVNDIPREYIDEMILVDDGSSDRTVEVANRLGLIVHSHEKNIGYGGTQKTCYRLALEHGADIIIMLHPDYQYDPKLVKYFIEFIRDGYFDVMLGSRIRTRREALEGGMPLYKYIGNRILTFIENLVSGQNLSEWHTGMRAYKREVLETINFNKNSNGFVFDSQVLFQIVENNFRIGEIPVPVRYFKNSSSIDFFESVKYGIGTLFEALSYLIRNFIRQIKKFL
ncbi:MAG: glycosyltransferase family 2 protein [Ignavibacteria bacterium]|nr:glycosyltransferase family 2 protein [Ignavibacteria bacterium]